MTIPVNITIKFNLLWHWIQNFWLHICTDDRFLSLPYHMNIFLPPISKNISFKKCACASRYFYIKQKGMTLLGLMYFITEYVRLEWLNVQINWVGWLEPWKKVDCAHSIFFVEGSMLSVPPKPVWNRHTTQGSPITLHQYSQMAWRRFERQENFLHQEKLILHVWFWIPDPPDFHLRSPSRPDP